MKIHLDEFKMAREYTSGHAFEDLSRDQTRLILDRGRELYKWFKAHPRTHALINALSSYGSWEWMRWSCCGFPTGSCLRRGGRERDGW